MYTAAEHSRKDTNLNIAVSLRRRSIAISVQGRNKATRIAVSIRGRKVAIRIAVSIRCRNISLSIRCRNVLEGKLLGNRGNNNLNINMR